MSSSTASFTRNEILKVIAKHLIPEEVPMKTFACLNITKNNADDEYLFNKAYIQYTKSGPGVPLWLMWHKSLSQIMKVIAGEDDSIEDIRVENAVECLVNFLSNETHRKYMSDLYDSSTEEHKQAVLSHHYFDPLVPNASCIIDHISFPRKLEKKCPGYNRSVNLGDTSLGNSSVWHGEADILIQKSAIMFGKEELEDYEEGYFEDHHSDDTTEPLPKRCKTISERQHINAESEVQSVNILTPCRNDFMQSQKKEDFVNEGSTVIEVKKEQNENSDYVVQALAQTIVNAFCEAKNNEQLHDMFIPSFLVTNTTISIYMYNCKQDRLFMLSDLPIWGMDKSEKSLNIETVICTWLTLNFDIFQNTVPGKEFEMRKLQSSNFQKTVGDKLLIYKEKMSKPMKKNDRKPKVEDTVKYCIDLHLINSDFVEKALETLKEVKTIYEKIEQSC